MFSIDYRKAFDRLSYSKIIQSLLQKMMPPNIVKLLISYLTDRRQRVVVQSNTSNWLDVPQGSVISPILFSLTIDEIFNVFPSQGNNFLVFYTPMICPFCITFQKIQYVGCEVSSVENGFQINTSKCYLLDVTRSLAHKLPNISIVDVNVSRVNNLKLLGVVFTANCLWNVHFDGVLCKIKIAMFLLSHLRKCGANNMILWQVYVSCVFSLMSY